MKIDILTLFPNMYDGFLSESIIKRAIDNKIVDINLINFRDYTEDKHNKVDDTPYGGGKGMVLMCDPIFKAVDKIRKKNSKVILLSPQGKKYDQKMAEELSKEKDLLIICGHYEGFDERIRSLCDMEISIGDYVLTGGEIPAMILVDSVKIFAQHYPCAAFNGDYHVYGHIHTLSDGVCYGADAEALGAMKKTTYDVGVDQNHYTPVSYWQLCDIIRKQMYK